MEKVLENTAKEIHSIAWAKGTVQDPYTGYRFYWYRSGCRVGGMGSGKSPVQKAFDFLSEEEGLTLSTI